MQASPLLRAHRRVLIAKRLHDQALKSLVPGLESSYRRLSKACWRRSKFDPRGCGRKLGLVKRRFPGFGDARQGCEHQGKL